VRREIERECRVALALSLSLSFSRSTRTALLVRCNGSLQPSASAVAKGLVRCGVLSISLQVTRVVHFDFD